MPKIDQLKTQIEYTLREMPETRNSDVALMIEVWKKYYTSFIRIGSGGLHGVWLKDIPLLPREDSVKRIRAMIQNERGLYLPSSLEVMKKRKINEEFWRAEMANNSIYKRL